MFARERETIPADEVPRDLSPTPQSLSLRRFFSVPKWLCVSRPQYSSSCGLSSLASVFNCLFSTLSQGSLPPVSVEELGEMIGFQPPLRSHGLFYVQTNSSLLRWFGEVCAKKRVHGGAEVLLKLKGKHRKGVEPEEALWRVIDAVKDPNKALIYHCEGHFMTIVGYELTPTLPTDAYKSPSHISLSDIEPWIIAADTNGKKSPLHSIKWSDVLLDLSLVYPQYYDVRRPELGVREHSSKLYRTGEYAGRNIHCILEFRRVGV